MESVDQNVSPDDASAKRVASPPDSSRDASRRRSSGPFSPSSRHNLADPTAQRALATHKSAPSDRQDCANTLMTANSLMGGE